MKMVSRNVFLTWEREKKCLNYIVYKGQTVIPKNIRSRAVHFWGTFFLDHPVLLLVLATQILFNQIHGTILNFRKQKMELYQYSRSRFY